MSTRSWDVMTPPDARGNPFYDNMRIYEVDCYGTDEMLEYALWQDYTWEPCAVRSSSGLVIFYYTGWIST